MAIHVAKNILLKLKKYKYKNGNVKIGILGISFKENCPDIRNSKVFEIYKSCEKSVESYEMCWVILFKSIYNCL